MTTRNISIMGFMILFSLFLAEEITTAKKIRDLEVSIGLLRICMSESVIYDKTIADSCEKWRNER